MGTSVWSGSISFGLVSIPIKLFTATTSHDISFNMLHKECKGRIQLQNYCPTCEEVVTRADLVKGYQYEKDQYALVTDEDLSSVKPESSSMMDIVQFIQLKEIDPIYFERTYFVSPDKGSEKAFTLLTRVMEETGRAAIGKMIMRNHEYLVLLRPGLDGMMAQFLLYNDEIRENEYRVDNDLQLRDKEMQLARELVENLTDEFDAAAFKDDYIGRLQEMLEAKIHGRKLTIVKPESRPKVNDLLEALQQSVKMARDKKPQTSTADRQTQARKLRKAR